MLNPTVRAARLPAAVLRKPAKALNRRFPHNKVKCPCPPLAPYPTGWLTLAQDEALQAIRAAFPTADWNPHTLAVRVGVPLAELLARVPLAAGCRVLTDRDRDGGCWLDLQPLGA